MVRIKYSRESEKIGAGIKVIDRGWNIEEGDLILVTKIRSWLRDLFSPETIWLDLGAFEKVEHNQIYLRKPYYQLSSARFAGIQIPLIKRGTDYDRSIHLSCVREILIGKDLVAEGLGKRNYGFLVELVRQMKIHYC